MKRAVIYGLLALLGIFILDCMGLSVLVQFGFFLVTGWAFFLVRVVPELRTEWGEVGLAVVSLALIAGLTHSFLGWICRSLGPAEGSKWRWRWTGSLVAGVVLMFAAGIAATGMVHQTGWLLTSPEPWFSGGRASTAARRAQSVNNLKQIGLAFHNYHQIEGTMPPGSTVDAEGRLLHGWQARLLPYLEMPELYQRIDFTRPWDDPRNQAVFETRVNAYLNPGIRDKVDGPGPSPSHYSANVLVLGGDSARKLNEITDGTSNTILAGEVPGNFKPWGHPANWRDPTLGINRSPNGFGGPSAGGANFLMADGSVRFLKNTVAPAVFQALGTPSGGEAISAESY